MTRFCFSTMFCFVLLLSSLHYGAEYHVSPTGSDTNSGTESQPFATIQRAQQAVRTFKANGPLKEQLTIILHDGTWQLSAPWVMTPEDSGTKEFPIVWTAKNEGQAIISGGVSLGPWRQYNEKLWVTDAPDSWKKGEMPRQLFVNGQRAIPARTPNVGQYFHTKKLFYQNDANSSWLGFKYNSHELGDWIHRPDIDLVMYHNWTNSHNRIQTIDPVKNHIMFQRPSGRYSLGPFNRYYVANFFEALDSPGEWFYDREKGLVFYYPRPGEQRDSATAIASRVLSSILVIQGDMEGNRPVSWLVFRGLSFRYTEPDLSRDYPHSVQGAHTQKGAFYAVGMEHGLVENCEFVHLGEHAISLREGCHDNIIRKNHCYDLGGGGIYLSEGAPKKTNDAWMTSRNIIDNNFLHDGGYVFAAGCGIFLGGSACYNKILHNEIRDFDWMGLHAGWSWSGTDQAWTHHNEFAKNHVHQIGNGVLNDIGGVYFLGISTGTHFHDNHLHHISRYLRGTDGYGGWGIYFDAGSSEILVENNIVHDTFDGGLHLHNYAYPHDNIIRNNIFAFSRTDELIRNALMETDREFHAKLSRNIVFESANVFHFYGGIGWKKGLKYQTDFNCFWNTESQQYDFAGRTFDAWQKEGNDRNSIIANPGFVNPEQRDFRLKQDSPVLKLGFQPISMDDIGLYGDETWRRLPDSFALRRVENHKEDPISESYSDDFEDYKPGDTPENASYFDGSKTANIRVTDQQGSANTRQSLRFIDEPGLKWQHDPHLCYTSVLPQGKVRASFELNLEENASVYVEWRHYLPNSSYHIGPVLAIDSQGNVSANGKQLTTIQRNKWYQFEMTCQTGQNASDLWSCRIISEGKQPLNFENLKCPAKLPKIDWIGFISNANTHAVFYLDQVKFQTVKNDN